VRAITIALLASILSAASLAGELPDPTLVVFITENGGPGVRLKRKSRR
jgi:hypothetical protein